MQLHVIKIFGKRQLIIISVSLVLVETSLSSVWQMSTLWNIQFVKIVKFSKSFELRLLILLIFIRFTISLLRFDLDFAAHSSELIYRRLKRLKRLSILFRLEEISKDAIFGQPTIVGLLILILFVLRLVVVDAEFTLRAVIKHLDISFDRNIFFRF